VWHGSASRFLSHRFRPPLGVVLLVVWKRCQRIKPRSYGAMFTRWPMRDGTAVVDSLKVLDPKRPIRKADIVWSCRHVG
jgi:hypothetical protein